MKTSGESRTEWKGHMSGMWKTDAVKNSSLLPFDKTIDGGTG